MADPRWTDETLKAARTASFDPGHFTPRGKVRAEDDFEPEALWAWQARAVLAALAEAGLLLPPGGEVSEDWATSHLNIDTLQRELTEVESREDAERHFGWLDQVWGHQARLMRRAVHRGPWVEVPNG